jgi:hypothetical protein
MSGLWPPACGIAWLVPSIALRRPEPTSFPRPLGSVARSFTSPIGPLSSKGKSFTTVTRALTAFTATSSCPTTFTFCLPRARSSLERAVQYIRGGSSREIGVQFQSHFPVWQPGFTEHRLRDEADYRRHVAYIDLNPVRARLATRSEEYPFSSADGKYRLDPWPLPQRLKP